MSSRYPGDVSTFNEATAPLLERLMRKRSHMPFDYKTAFNELLDLSKVDGYACIDAADELLKQQLPEGYRMRTHIVLATCLEDLDEMEEHYAEALRIWTRLNARYISGEKPEADIWLQQTRAMIDCLWDTIQEEKELEEQSDGELSMSAIATVETVPVVENATSTVMSQSDQPSQSGQPSQLDQSDLKNTSSDRSTFTPPPVELSMSAVAATETFPVVENATSRAMGQPGQPGLVKTSTERSSLIPGRHQTPIDPSGASRYRATSPSDVD
jgi:hypothetical protein